MATPAVPTVRQEKPGPAVAEPLLEPGVRLSRDEFERRYERMPHLKKAELIEGIMHQKKDAYRRNGVLEYIAWITGERRLLWWELREGEYHERAAAADGLLKSGIFP